MDGDRKSRKQTLDELKRLRAEGNTHFQTARIDENEGESAYEDDSDLADFVEDMGDMADGPSVPAKRNIPPVSKPMRSFFNRSARPNIAATNSAVNKKDVLEKDDYFKSLLQQMDSGEEDSSEDEPEPAAPRKALTRLEEIKNEDAGISSIGEHPPSSKMDGEEGASMPVLPSDFAPFDHAALNAAVIAQLEAGNWADPFDDEVEDALNHMEPHDQGFKQEDQLAGLRLEDFMKENEVPMMDIDDGNRMAINDAPLYGTQAQPAAGYAQPEEGYVDVYWLDAFERSNGTVFLFGKMKRPDGEGFCSVCVTVNNIQRNLFFLPRETIVDADGNDTEEPVTLKAVQEEIAEVMGRMRVKKYNVKRVVRKYAFEVPDVPVESDYMKVTYGFNEPQLPATLKSGRTFSHLFGAGTNALELLLLKRKMMGPAWLRIKPASSLKQNISWCKAELQVDSPKDIRVLENGPETPSLTVMSLTLRTVQKNHVHEIVSASGLVFNSVSADGQTGEKTCCSSMFSVVRDLEDLGFPAKFSEALSKARHTKLEIARNERALLAFLLAMLHRHDPDVIVGHNFLGFDLGVLLHRMKACKVDLWSRLGRLNWSQWPKARLGSTEASYAEKQVVAGRLVCDTYLCAKDLVKAKSYGLQELVEQVLGAQREPFDYETVATHFGSAEALAGMLKHAEMDGYYQATMAFKLMVLPLTKQLTSIAGNLWSRTLCGGRAERNEFLLLHEFHGQKYIVPDKPAATFRQQAQQQQLEDDEANDDNDNKKGGGKRKPAYAGGLVLEPKKGFYDKIVLLLDFNSLYPSIIQEFNICFTTVARDPSSDALPDVPDPAEPTGILPRVLKSLVERRGQVKRLMKDPKTPPGLLATYNTRQQALKLTANSMYGCLGFTLSRFYAKPLAMLITAKGREILQSTVQLAQQQCHLDVVYGDTDSIMLNTGTADLATAKKLAAQVKRAVNERYRLLEIELDGVFEKLLLLKKKKYSALVLEERPGGEPVRKLETKGLDMVRRDWAKVSVDASTFVLNRIMYDEAKDEALAAIHKHLTELGEAARNGQLPLESFVITKSLTKDPEAYADAKSQPHVQVALRLKGKGLSVRAGDVIPYVICTEAASGAGDSLAARAYHPDEVRKDTSLRIDAEWYLVQQVHPPIARLCEHIDGTDSARIALCLGLDAKKYGSHGPSSNTHHANDGPRLMTGLSDEEKYRECRKLEILCHACRALTPVNSIVTSVDQHFVSALACAACHVKFTPQALYCQILTLIRETLESYHAYWLQCDECQTQTRRMRVYESRCVTDACRGTMSPRLTGQHVYTQLLYLKSMFDFEKVRARLAATDNDGSGLALVKALAIEYEPVRAMILHQLNQCSFPIINLREIFSFMTTLKL